MSEKYKKVIVTKIPREDNIPDIPVSFPPLQNLHLEFLENKQKIKDNLPPLKQEKPPSSPIILNTSQENNFKNEQRDSNFERIKILSNDDDDDEEPEIVEKSSLLKNVPYQDDEEDDDDIIELPNDYNNDDILDDIIDDEEQLPNEVENHNENGYYDESEEIEDEEEEQLTPEEKELEDKMYYIWKFKILKKEYKDRIDDIQIPIFNEHSDLKMMKRKYDDTVRELYLDDAVEQYKTYLYGGFLAIEFLSTKFLGIDMSGLTVHQTAIMHKYDRMLIELGEKSYGQWGRNLPVEIRLIGFAILQTGIFYLAKMIKENYGENASNILKGFFGVPSVPGSSEEDKDEKPKKKMRGPSRKVKDFRKEN